MTDPMSNPTRRRPRCRGPKCRRDAKALGLCDTHLHQHYRTGRLWVIGQPPPRLVECCDCGTQTVHHALGRCRACYYRFRRQRQARLVAV